MNIIQRLDSAFNVGIISEAENPPEIVVDMNDPAARKMALHNCKGPNVGWDDYVAGRDYIPPRVFTAGSKQPIGPKDTGKRGLSERDSHNIKFDENPYSHKYGGIRPWSVSEVIETLIGKLYDEYDNSVLRRIAKKGSVSGAAAATHGGTYDENDIRDAMMRGAEAAIQVLPGDRAEEGVRFDSYIGIAIEQAMRSGVPPGYHDEYRKARGIRRNLTSIAKSAIRNIRNGERIEGDIMEVRKIFANFNRCPDCEGTGEIQSKNMLDKEGRRALVRCVRCGGRGELESGPKHPYGILADELLEVRSKLLRAITSGSAKEIQRELESMDEVFDKIEQNESKYKSLGSTRSGAVGTKPREHGSLVAYNKAAKLLDKQRELARHADKLLSNGQSSDQLVDAAKKLWHDFKYPISKSKYGKTGTVRKTAYVSRYEPHQKDLHKSPGSIGLAAITARLEEALRSNDREQLEEFISMSEHQQEMIRTREQVNLQAIHAASMDVGGDDDEQTERTDFASTGTNVDYLHSEETREKLAMTIAKVSPYQDDSVKRKEQAEEAAEIFTAIREAVDSYLEARSENLDTTKAISDLKNIAQDVGDLGEWKEEISELLKSIFGTIEIHGGFSEIRTEINDLLKVAKQDIKLKPSPETVSVQQYRMLLRIYGIDNYPERDTPQDPEITASGGKSQWAEAGYPAVGGVEIGRKTPIHVWTDIFDKVDEKGEHICSVSNAHISKLRTAAMLKFTSAANAVKQEIGESCGFDSIEYKMISEFHLCLCKMVVEEVVPGANKLIYG
jgi:transcription elongation factor Elf1